MSVSRNRNLLLTLCALAVLGGIFRVAASRQQKPAASNSIVISQIYGGGGNGGATLKNDFIELFNASGSPVDISTWSIQYGAPSGSSWQVTNLCPNGGCTIAPGHYFLIQEAQGSAGTTDLPTPNAIGTIAMGAVSGKVALVNGTTAISGPCPGGLAVDFVGYGGANCFDGNGSAASAATNTTALLRVNNGCTDTDTNSSDFATGSPNPRNSSSPAITCGVSPSPSPTPSPTPTPDCGVERWSVKTGTDTNASGISFVSQSTSIATMRSWTPPSPIPPNSRSAPFETTVWTVSANLLEYKFEDDSDYHIVLQDAAGNTIIGEIPHPGCVGSGSPFATSIINARLKFNAMFTASSSFKFANVPVQVTGVGMFDFLHGQTGVAPNGIELHPILDIVFTNSSTPQLALNESATNEASALTLLLIRDPFDPTNSADWLNSGADHNSRIIVFADNLQLAQGETASSVVVRLIDSSNDLFEVPAEDVRTVPNQTITQITFRLPDNVASGACVITIKAHGQASNSATIRIR
jgi:hypothetical protein